MIKYIRYILSIFVVSTISTSCEEDLPTQLNFSSYEFTSVDNKGGTWTPILLTAPNQVAITAPLTTSSPEYQAELAAVRSARGSLTAAQLEAVDYWGNNPIIRWNEIALELVAKYNLIPGPNPDGTYTLPSAANPVGPPAFPFANPPYTCRMLAYLSVAQYDGLIAAWHYKYQFNRPAPYTVDNTIVPAFAKNTLPSYPSDGAVVAVVSREVLTAMFPLEKDYLEAKAEEQLNSLIWSGTNVASDIEAGKTLGTGIKNMVLARANNDGMRNAQAPKAVSDAIKAAAFARFGWQWENQESPVRPVGLMPLFGSVTLWNVPSVQVVRPPVPPAPGSPAFNEAVKELQDVAKNLTNEQRKIANWWSDGLSTYTPPGHWNRFAKEFVVKYKMNPLRTARTFAYLNMAVMDAGIACWDAKYYYHYPRPIQTIPGFKTILGTPNFPAYTSGHSTFSAAAAEVLSYIFPAEANQCRAWAKEAAESRIYGGIHYRFDSEAGLEQGKQVGIYSVNRAKADGAD